MALQKLLSSGLVLIVLTAITTAVTTNNDMQQFIEPDYYDINLTLHIEGDHINKDVYNNHIRYILNQRSKNNSIFYADFQIIFKVTQETQDIYLHAYNLDVCTSMQLFNHHNDTGELQEIKWLHCWNDIEEQFVIFSFNDKIQLGTYTLKMKYVGAITNYAGGIFKTSYIDENGDRTWLYAAGNFLPHEIRQVLPCWDKPSTEVIIRSIFIRSHGNYTVLTGLPVLTNNNVSDPSIITSHPFVTSIYHVAFVVSRLYHASNANETVNMWCRKQIAHHTKFAQNIAKNVTMFLKENNDLNITHVAIPGFRNKGMNNWNLILYSEAAVTYDEQSDPIMQKIEVARLIGYKIVHHMLGYDKRMSSWSDLWIIEGIAMFYGAHIIDKIIPDMRMMDLFVVQAKYEALRWDAYYDIPIEVPDDELSREESIWFYPRYLKASLLMLMIRHVILSDAFFDLIQKLYLNAQSLLIVFDSNRFWYEVETLGRDFHYILHQGNLSSVVNIKEMMSAWTKQRHYPVLHVYRQNDTNETNTVIIELLLSHNFNISYQNNTWLPITYITQSSPTINPYSDIDWICSEEEYVDLKLLNDDWIIVNPRQNGYYRVYYDLHLWRKIISYLYTDNYTKIHVLNRAQLIDDVYYFLSMHLLHYSIFHQMTHYLSKETDYIVWYAMFKNMEHMSSFFVFPESTQLKKHLREILDGLMIKIKYDEDPNDNYYTKCLRQEAAKWACILDSLTCKKMAVIKMRQHLANKTINFSPFWIDWAYCARMSSINSTEYTQLLNQYETLLLSDNKILEHLTCATSFDNVKNYLNILQTQIVDTYKIPNKYKIFLSLIAKHANKNEVLKFILTNFDTVRPSEISSIVAVIVIIDHVYDELKLNQIKNFVIRNNFNKLYPYIQQKTKQRVSEINRQIIFWKFLGVSKHLI